MRRLSIAALLLALPLAATPAVAQSAPSTPAPAASAAPAAPAATASHRAAVARLMEVTRVKELTEQGAATMLDAQLRQMPQLAPVSGVLRDFYREQLAWSVLEPEYTQLYLEVFSEQEVRDLVAFYQTPLGRTMLTKMPALMARTNEMTTRRMQAAMPQLMQRLQAAMQGQAGGAGGAPPTR